MTSEEPRDDRCAAKCRDGGYCTQYPIQGAERCRMHGGQSPTGIGAPERNQNAKRHGLHSTPEYLRDHFDDHQEEEYIALFEALCTRYDRIHGYEPDYAAKKRLSRVSIEIIKEDLADQWLAEKAETSGHLLIEHREDVTDDGERVEYDLPNDLLSDLTALKRETRLTLKDMGLLSDPQSKQADAIRELANDDYEIVIDGGE